MPGCTVVRLLPFAFLTFLCFSCSHGKCLVLTLGVQEYAYLQNPGVWRCDSADETAVHQTSTPQHSLFLRILCAYCVVTVDPRHTIFSSAPTSPPQHNNDSRRSPSPAFRGVHALASEAVHGGRYTVLTSCMGPWACGMTHGMRSIVTSSKRPVMGRLHTRSLF